MPPIITIPPEVISEAAEKAVADMIASGGDLSRVRLLKTPAAAKLLAISPRVFDALTRSRGIKPVVLGPRLTRWRLSDLAKLVNPTE